jgi:hypothetical protein
MALICGIKTRVNGPAMSDCSPLNIYRRSSMTARSIDPAWLGDLRRIDGVVARDDIYLNKG